jgi:uncharacterized membrane protein HdeD (DUF308 family)
MSDQAMASPIATSVAPKHWGWLVALGAVAAAVGVSLLFHPFDAIATLAWLVGFALLVEAIDFLMSARYTPKPWLSYIVGAVYVVTALIAIAWPGVTLFALAVVVGVGFVIGGIAAFVARSGSWAGPGRTYLLIAGIVSILAGILALAWPDVTIVALAVVLGVRVLLSGLSLIGAGLDLRKLA